MAFFETLSRLVPSIVSRDICAGSRARPESATTLDMPGSNEAEARSLADITQSPGLHDFGVTGCKYRDLRSSENA